MAATIGVWWHPPVPLAVGTVIVLVALAVRRPVLLVVGIFAVGAALGVRAQDGLAPLASAPFEGTVTLVNDPRETPFGLRVDARVGDKRVEMEASNSAAGALTAALAGERIHVVGALSPPPPTLRGWCRATWSGGSRWIGPSGSTADPLPGGPPTASGACSKPGPSP